MTKYFIIIKKNIINKNRIEKLCKKILRKKVLFIYIYIYIWVYIIFIYFN